LFKNLFEEVYEKGIPDRYRGQREQDEHRMVDELAAHANPLFRRFRLGLQELRPGDIQSDMVAAGFGSLGLMNIHPFDAGRQIVLTEAAHGTVTRHFREHQAGRETSTNPSSSFAWTRALLPSGSLR
jgi:isocitrate dehydrogenase